MLSHKLLEIVLQRPGDEPAIEDLLDHCFEPQRNLRPTYRLRDGFAPVDDLSFVALDGGRLAGTLRFWPISIGGATAALLLGPLAVHPDARGRGGATSLVRRGLGTALGLGHRIVIAVGERDFFSRFDFIPARQAGFAMPLPVEEARFFALELIDGALADIRGVLGPAVPPTLDSVAERAMASR